MKRSAPLGLLLVSGALALGYQVVWSKLLLEFIGVSAYSYAVVLAAFMAGLALGSAWFGRMADRLDSPIRLYALLELGVGAYAFAILPLTRAAGALYGRVASVSAEDAGATFGIWAKVLAAGILLIPPTVLLGGTFPAMVRQVAESSRRVGRHASELYAANALGAVLGALVMAFVCLPWLGLTRSLWLLGSANFAVAAIALLLARWLPRERSDAADASPAPAAPATAVATGRTALWLILATGFTGFAFEVGWTRFFAVVLGSSTYSFAVMLAAYISGIAVGAAILARADARIRNPLHWFGWTQVGAGLIVLATVGFYPYVPLVFREYVSLLSQRRAAFYLYELGKLGLCYAIMLPPTLLLGMSLPLVVKSVADSLSRAGQDIGRVYAWNTWGNVAGALAAGLFLLPALGTEALLRSAAIVSVLLGATAVTVGLAPAGERRRRLAVLAALAAAAVLQLSVGAWRGQWFTLNPSRRANYASPGDTRRILDRRTVEMWVDDPAAQILVQSEERNGIKAFSLLVNGKVDASSGHDMATQVLMAHLPVLLHPAPKSVLIIGLASGITAGTVLRHDVRRVDVVDIVAAMPRASAFFSPWNGDPLEDPRTTLIIDDARSYVSHTRERYDVIISEPSNPWTAGTGSLFSNEFYARARGVLAPGGLYLQWVQAYELSNATFAAIVRSFRRSFPHVYGFQASPGDLLLIGAQEAIPPPVPAQLARRFEIPAVREQLAAIGVGDPAALLFLQIFSPASVDFLASRTALENTDDNRLLEYRAPRDLFQGVQVRLPDTFDERHYLSPALFWSGYFRERPGEVDLRSMATMLRGAVEDEPLAEACARAALRLASPPERERRLYDDLTERVRATDQDKARSMIGGFRATILLESAFSPARAELWLERTDGLLALARDPETRFALSELHAHLLRIAGRDADAVRELESLAAGSDGSPGKTALRVVCVVRPGADCDRAIERFLEKRSDEDVKRLQQMRTGSW